MTKGTRSHVRHAHQLGDSRANCEERNEQTACGAHSNTWQSVDLADIVPALALPRHPQRAIDVGCGSGDDTRRLAEVGFHAVGVDVREDVLADAASNTSPGIDVQWRLGSARALPAANASCVLVTDRGCLHHIDSDDVPLYVSEVIRVLVPGGAWVIRDMLGHGRQHRDLDFEFIHGLAREPMLVVENYEIRDAVPDHEQSHSIVLAALRRI